MFPSVLRHRCDRITVNTSLQWKDPYEKSFHMAVGRTIAVFHGLGRQSLHPAATLYGEHAGLVACQTNFLLGTYVIGLIPGLLVAAALSDVYGRKPITLAGLISSIVGNLIILLSSTSVTMLYTGRFFAGLAVGIGMSVGTSWIKELSTRQWDPKATAAAGARRPSLTMTLGFGCGAAVSGALAQWVPAPT